MGMTQHDFINRLRSLWNIDAWQLPELGAQQQKDFVFDPARYLMRANDAHAAAIWREIERRQSKHDKSELPFQPGDLVVQIGNEHFGMLRVVDCEWIDTTRPGVPHYWLVTAEVTGLPIAGDYPPGTTGIVTASISRADANRFRLVDKEERET